MCDIKMYFLLYLIKKNIIYTVYIRICTHLHFSN